jgi:hypothetical protein
MEKNDSIRTVGISTGARPIKSRRYKLLQFLTCLALLDCLDFATKSKKHVSLSESVSRRPCGN